MQSSAHGLRTDRRYRIQIGNYYCNCFRKHGWRRYCGNFIGKRRKGYKRSHNYYEKSSQTVSSSSKPTGITVTTTKKSGSSGASGNSIQGQNNSVQNNNGQEITYSLRRIVSRPIIRRPITIRAITVRSRITNRLTISLRITTLLLRLQRQNLR